MLVLSVGEFFHFKTSLISFGSYEYKEIAVNERSFFVLPKLEKHEDYEDYAVNHEDILKDMVYSLEEKPVCVVGPNLESGIFLVLLKLLNERFGKVDVVIFTKVFTSSNEIKFLSRALFGVLYNFLNIAIENLFWFSFDIMRKLYSDIKIIRLDEWYNKCASLFHKRMFYYFEKPEVELTGEIMWDQREVEDILKTPKLVLVTEVPLTEEIVNDNNLYIYRVIYHSPRLDDLSDSNFEKSLEKRSEVYREYKFYEIGSTEVVEYFLFPEKI